MARSASGAVSETLSELAVSSIAAASTVAQLRRRLVEETCERDKSRFQLQHLQKSVASVLKELIRLFSSKNSGMYSTSSTAGISACVEKVRDVLQTLDEHVQQAAQNSSSPLKNPSQTSLNCAIRDRAHIASSGGDSPTSADAYRVLRQSLQETELRCESLKANLKQQSEANEELVASVATVKDRKKSLLDQLQSQAGEIQVLTQQRVCDEDRVEQLKKQHQEDEQQLKQQMERQVFSIQDAVGDKRRQLRERLQERLRHFKARLEFTRQDASWLQEEQQRIRSDAVFLAEAMASQIVEVTARIGQECAGHAAAKAQHRTMVEETIGDLQVELRSECQRRQTEKSTWIHRHSSTQTQMEDLQAQVTRDITRFTCCLQAQERNSAGGRHTWPEDRAKLERDLEDGLKTKLLHQDELEELERKIVRLDSSYSGIASEVKAADDLVAEFQAQASTREDALVVANSGNAFLQKQLEEQKRRLHDRSEEELARLKTALERRQADAQNARQAEAELTLQQLQAMEESIRSSQEFLGEIQMHVDSVDDECARLEQDLADTREKHAAETTRRQTLEQSLGESRQASAEECLRWQAGSDSQSQSISELESEIFRSEELLAGARLAVTSSQTEADVHANSAGATLQESQDHLDDLRKRLRRTLAAREQVDTELASEKAEVFAAQALVGQQIADKMRTIEDQRDQLTEVFAGEQKAVVAAKEIFAHERSTSFDALQRVLEEGRTKLAVFERERARVEDSSRVNLSDAAAITARQEEQTQALEQELDRVRRLLQDAECRRTQVAHDEAQQLIHGKDRNASLLEELRFLTESLERASREEKSLTRQVDASEERNECERQMLSGDFDELRRLSPVASTLVRPITAPPSSAPPPTTTQRSGLDFGGGSVGALRRVGSAEPLPGTGRRSESSKVLSSWQIPDVGASSSIVRVLQSPGRTNSLGSFRSPRGCGVWAPSASSPGSTHFSTTGLASFSSPARSNGYSTVTSESIVPAALFDAGIRTPRHGDRGEMPASPQVSQSPKTRAARGRAI